MQTARLFVTLLGIATIQWIPVAASQAQDAFDASWYNPDANYVKIGVAADGVFRVSGTDLAGAGIPISTVPSDNMRLIQDGLEIPIHVSAAGATLGDNDWFSFVGKRNTGASEKWAYNEIASNMSSTFNSLYTDTTFYWLTWGGEAGLRFAETDPASSGPPTSRTTPARIHLEDDVFYYAGDGSSAGNPIYTLAEGFYHDRIRHNTSQSDILRSFSFDLVDGTELATDTVEIGIHVTAETVSRHKIVLEVGLDVGSGVVLTPLDSTEWVGIAARTITARVAQNDIPGDAPLQVRLRSRNNYSSATPNNLLMDWIDINYVRTIRPNLGQISVQAPSGPRTTVASGLTNSIRVYRPETGETFERLPSSGEAAFVLSPSDTETMFIVEGDGYLPPALVATDSPSNLASPPSGGADYVIITTPMLRPSADAMAAYRASVAGGGYSTLVVDINDIYDQFDYGRPTPIAIRRFVRTARLWSTPIEFLALWGDALYPNRSRPRLDWEVPSFGHTVSDGWFGMQNASLLDFSVSVAIGRLPIRTNAEGNIVVQKMQTYEAAPMDLWQKTSMYLAGGTTDAERSRLQQSALRWSSLVANKPATLEPVHFFKKSANVLDPTFKDSIQQTLEGGASWLTYFGHSATQTWEIVTDPPSMYNNATRLPVILSLGCFTGDFGTGTGDITDLRSFSEQLVVESINGSIAHWGASSSGTIGASERFSDEVHQSVFTDSLRTLGIALKAAKERYNALYSDPISVKHLLQYGLIGDPATRISLPSATDFRVQAQDIKVTPFSPVPSDNELTVTVAVRNVGLYPTDTTRVAINHVLPTGASAEYSVAVPPFTNLYELEVRAPIDGTAVGQNSVRVTLDADDVIQEQDELNNTAEQSVTVFSSGLEIAEPVNYALFPSTDVNLVVNTSSVLESPTVIFEIDTLRSFDSNQFATTEVASSGLTASWQPPGLLDETLYYWRARINAPGQDDVWSTRSFTIRSSLGATGWYQADAQFVDDVVSPSLAKWDGGWEFNSFAIDASASSTSGGGVERGQFVFNGQFYEKLELGFGLLLVDGATARVKASTAGATYVNDFDDPVQVVAELNAVAALAAPGDYVMTRTRHIGNYTGETSIPDSIRAIFRGLGSVQIDSVSYQDLWIMFGKIGSPESIQEFVVPPSAGITETTERFAPEFNFDEATITSPAIGPVSAWHDLTINGITEGAGEIEVDILDASGQTVIQSGVQVPSTVPITADARTNGFLRIRATASDSTRQSTPQLVNWRVAFSPVAELAIDPASLSLSADSVAVGTPLTAAVSFLNLSSVTADSVVISYDIIDSENRTTTAARDTVLAVSDQGSSSKSFDTEGFVGENRLRIDVRQPGLSEPISVNNVAIIPFKVSGDETAPSFAVVVDGEELPHDPDPVVNLQDPALPFVSARPVVEIAVDDDFDFQDFDTDSTSVLVFLDDEQARTDQLDVQLSPDRHSLNILFEPDLSSRDSTHTLRVEVRDARGNDAVGSPYQTHFRVQNAIQVEAAYPYPNPMSNNTRFAFRLRGADAMLIQDMVLRIYSISGRLVRQFDLTDDPESLESGGLKIGWNKILWDGRDSDGDRVATGVYLYRLHARADGAELDTGKVEKIAVIR